jgi:hypothetical protein
MVSQAQPEVEWVQSHKTSPGRLSFLDLPRELRDLVYEYAFRVSGAIFIYSSDVRIERNARAVVVRNKGEGPLEPQRLGKMISIALLRCCRQIHAESSPVLFGRNSFRLYAANTDFAPRYRAQVRHIIFTADSVVQKIFDNDPETVGYWWRRHFWPDITEKSSKLLQTYPALQTLSIAIKSSRHGETWRPAFIASEQKTPEQRIALAAAWLKAKCPFGSERLRKCLELEIIPSAATIAKEAYEGSRFEEEEGWDCSEFAAAFKKMKVS